MKDRSAYWKEYRIHHKARIASIKRVYCSRADVKFKAGLRNENLPKQIIESEMQAFYERNKEGEQKRIRQNVYPATRSQRASEGGCQSLRPAAQTSENAGRHEIHSA